ncbi:MAG TPA: hypothetical protein PK530_04690, partial [Anaerolineales bacterium]|nr:hypothetical protein [Anaerolineales bacterium]
MFAKIKNFQIMRGGIPLAIFLLCALTFGPLITQLGFYWDDWTVIEVIHLKQDLWEFYAYNRPASAWTQAFFAPVLGTSTLYWHLFAEGAWALTAVACWWMLDRLWPTHKRQTTAMAMLFAVHPLFLLHPIAVAFSQQYLTFLPFFISMGAMLAAMRNPARFWLWTGIGLLTMAIHMLTMEYFWGLELARPLLIWVVLQDRAWGLGRKTKGLQTLKIWGPYVAVLMGVVIWRMFFVTFSEGDPNELVMLDTIASNPLAGVGQLAQTVVYDLVYMLVHRWAETVDLEWFNLQDEFLWVVWGMALLTGVGATLFLKCLKDFPAPLAPRNEQWQIIGVGLWMMIVGGLAVWLPGRSVVNGLYDDRFALPLLPGVAILTIGGIGFFAQPQVRAALAGILLGLAVAMHLRVQNDYRWDWVNQQRAFWQFYWRAPALAENTVVFSDGTLFRYTG